MRAILVIALSALTFVPSSLAATPLTTRIAETQVAVWKCQDQRGVERTRPAVSPWSLPKSKQYRKWTLQLWQQRKKACLTELHALDGFIRTLQVGLAGTPMSGSEGDLVRAAKRWHISPFFIAAIAGTESSFGAAACSSNRFNAFGLSSCGSGWRVPNFQSWYEAYDFMGRFLTGNTSVTSGWPNARTTYDYHGYAACSECWGRKTAQHMASRFGVGPEVRF